MKIWAWTKNLKYLIPSFKFLIKRKSIFGIYLLYCDLYYIQLCVLLLLNMQFSFCWIVNKYRKQCFLYWLQIQAHPICPFLWIPVHSSRFLSIPVQFCSIPLDSCAFQWIPVGISGGMKSTAELHSPEIPTYSFILLGESGEPIAKSEPDPVIEAFTKRARTKKKLLMQDEVNQPAGYIWDYI